jgi:hypothetical protein
MGENAIKKMTFKEYWKSKKRLIMASDEPPRVSTTYKLTKYCKVPFFEDISCGVKRYLSFKPNDEITIHWVYNNFDSPTPNHVDVISENKSFLPCWKDEKMIKWVNQNTVITE